MKAVLKAMIVLFLLPGCFGSDKKDLITATISRDKLQDDMLILKNIIKEVHAGAYVFNTPAQINQLFDSVMHTIDGPLTTREFYNKVDAIVDRLKCIHSETYLPGEYFDSISNKAMFFPIPLTVINNKIYVNSDAFTIPLGAQILTVNHMRSGQIIHQLQPYYHTDGNSNLVRNSAIDDDFAFDYYMANGAYEHFNIDYEDPETGAANSVFIKAKKLSDINKNAYDQTYFYFSGNAPYDFKITESGKTAVLTLRTFFFETYETNQAFEHFVENSFRLLKLSGIRNLVIDCRNNNGGYYSSTYSLLSHLVNQPMPQFDSAIKRFDKLPYPDYVAEEDTSEITYNDTIAYKFTAIRKGVYAEKKEQIKQCVPGKFFYKGRIFVIINSRVISAAATFAAILKDKANALVVGEESGGGDAAHNSMAVKYTLPNSKITIDVPTVRFYQPVTHRLEGRGVMPQKNIPLTVDDLVSYTDAPMSYILDSIIAQ